VISFCLFVLFAILDFMVEVEINKKSKLTEHLASPSVASLSHSNELDGLRLSPHFTLGEMTKTSHKTADGNIPSHVAIENLKRLCGWLEMLRDVWNERYGEGNDPIIINSAYRSWEVNKKAGGSSTSNHLVGCAADIRCLGKEQALRYTVILLDIADESKEDFDELIIEVRGSTVWVHFAVRPKGNRRRIVFDVK
jgi:hypothetical protein